MKAWIDIENPPQVQYLVPFVDAFRRKGLEALVTARDYGITTELLRARGVAFDVVGREFGASRTAKWRGTIARALRLAAKVGRAGRPSLLLSTSRSAAMAAWALRTPSFMVLDYEHAELDSFRSLGTTVLHPAAIDSAVFLAKGFKSQRLWSFAGIKEDITFAGRDLDAVHAHDFGLAADGPAIVLVRPPSETSHYFDTASRDLTHGVLARLADEPAVRVVFSPRHTTQVDDLRAYAWRNDPIVLNRPVEFASLLKAVDCVICAGGTMLREAAYLGVPAISILGSEVGAVDRQLERQGAIRFVARPEDLRASDWLGGRTQGITRHVGVVDELVERMLAPRL